MYETAVECFYERYGSLLFYRYCPSRETPYIWGNPNRKNSEKYGFVIPLAPDLHPNGVHAGKDAVDIDLKLKQMAQMYFEEHYGTRKKFREVFGKSWL